MTADDDEAQIQIPADSVTILDLLLRAGLCAPHMWDEALEGLPAVERDETRDALTQGAWPLPQLTWEWGATVGQIDPLQPGGQDIDLTEFYDSLNGLSDVFALQISIPIIEDVHEHVAQMAPFPGQRVHLVNRGEWMNFGPPPDDVADLLEDVEDADIPNGLPVFTDPALQVGERRTGEVWVRFHPEQIADLKRAPEELFNLLIWVADTRVRQLRETIRLRQSSITEDAIVLLATKVDRVSSWQRLLHRAFDILRDLPPEARAEKLPGVLEIATGHWEPLSVFVSYSRDSDIHRKWVERLANALEPMREFHVVFDGYELHAGKDLTHFMERGVTSDRVVVVITPEYVRKATARVGGVGYESSVISSALFQDQLTDRFVPVLREGIEIPPFLRTKLYVDFRDDDRFESALAELRSALLRLAPLRRPSKER